MKKESTYSIIDIVKKSLKESNVIADDSNILETCLRIPLFDYLTKNLKKFINENKYGEFYAIYNECFSVVAYDEVGIPFSFKFTHEYIQFLKKIFSFFIEYKEENDILRPFYTYLYAKKHICEIDYYQYYLNHQNIQPENIGVLSLYSNNIETFNKYLYLLDNCNQETTKLILDVIKPMSIEFIEYYKNNQFEVSGKLKKGPYKSLINDFWAIPYIINEECTGSSYKIQKGFVYTPYDDCCWMVNVLYIKTLEYSLTKAYQIIEEILKRDNHDEILKKIIEEKKKLLEAAPIFYSVEEDVPIMRYVEREFWGKPEVRYEEVGTQKETTYYSFGPVYEKRRKFFKSVASILNKDIDVSLPEDYYEDFNNILKLNDKKEKVKKLCK